MYIYAIVDMTIRMSKNTYRPVFVTFHYCVAISARYHPGHQITRLSITRSPGHQSPDHQVINHQLTRSPIISSPGHHRQPTRFADHGVTKSPSPDHQTLRPSNRQDLTRQLDRCFCDYVISYLKLESVTYILYIV